MPRVSAIGTIYSRSSLAGVDMRERSTHLYGQDRYSIIFYVLCGIQLGRRGLPNLTTHHVISGD